MQEESPLRDKAVQESKQNEGLPLLSNQFSKQRGSMGCLLRARSVLQGHGVLALRHTPSTRAVQAESQLQEEAGKGEAGSAGRQAK